MKKSIYLKLFIGYLIITIFLTTLILFFSFNKIRIFYLENLTKNLKDTGLLLNSQIITYLKNDENTVLNNIIQKYGKLSNIRITIISLNGKVLADSKENPKLMENFKDVPKISEISKTELGSPLRFSPSLKGNIYYVALPITDMMKNTLGVQILSFDSKNFDNFISELKLNIIGVSFLLILISLTFAMILLKYFNKSVTNASQSIAMEEFKKNESNKLEKIKSDFTSNVSHELRTPLTAIKGYLETIKDSVDKKIHDYIIVIERNMDRLINIVEDLSELTELEERKKALKIEKVNIKNLIYDIKMLFENRINEKKLKFVLEDDKINPSIYADAFKMEQMFINLFDNAIKYTEKGEIKVSLKQIDDKIIIELSDTGIGIPNQDVERIFERFYVVDKSRSRKYTGSGLGLAIVKHIILLHKGEISVKSIPDIGTKFIITIPTNISISKS